MHNVPQLLVQMPENIAELKTKKNYKNNKKQFKIGKNITTSLANAEFLKRSVASRKDNGTCLNTH